MCLYFSGIFYHCFSANWVCCLFIEFYISQATYRFPWDQPEFQDQGKTHHHVMARMTFGVFVQVLHGAWVSFERNNGTTVYLGMRIKHEDLVLSVEVISYYQDFECLPYVRVVAIHLFFTCLIKPYFHVKLSVNINSFFQVRIAFPSLSGNSHVLAIKVIEGVTVALNIRQHKGKHK